MLNKTVYDITGRKVDLTKKYLVFFRLYLTTNTLIKTINEIM